MTKLVEGLASGPPKGVWTVYGRVNTYTDRRRGQRALSFGRPAEARRGAHLWSGTSAATMGAMPVLLLRRARAVALDSDQGPVELL